GRDRLVSLAHPGPAPILPPEADPQLAPGEACGEPPATAAAPPDEPSAPVKPANATKRKLRILLIALVIVGVVGVLVRVKLSSSSSGENITVVSAAPERPLIPAAAPLIPAAPAPPAGEIAPRITAIASQDGFATDKFTAEESSAIWQSWKNGDQEIALPPVLKSTMRIELEFKPDSPYAALPQDAGEKYIIIDGGSPLKRLELRIADDKLKMSEPEATDTPRRADLAAVRFIDRQGRVMRYEPNAKSSFELAVKDPGQVTVEERKGAMVWVYHPSEPVKILGDLATVIVGGVKLKSVVLRGGSSASTVVRMSTAPFDRYALAFSKFRTASESAGAVRQERNAILEKALAAREGLADLLKLKRYQALLDGLKLSYESTGSTYAAQEKALNDLKLKLGNDGRIDSNKKQPMLKMLADYSEGLSALRVCEPRLTAAVAAEKSAQKAFNAAVAELLKTVNAISPDFGNKLGSHLETQKSLPPPEKCISDWCPKFEVTIKPAEATDRP
ncbi:MAG: hypothetical protein PHI35_00370, partial [Victivallaceae bacterium]|nr:hypothetical protein [Victivallaceae bacterium]